MWRCAQCGELCTVFFPTPCVQSVLARRPTRRRLLQGGVEDGRRRAKKQGKGERMGVKCLRILLVIDG